MEHCSSPVAPDRADPLAGTETILVAEDEEVLRKLLRRSLTPLGYTLLEARDAEHALEIEAGYAGPIHLLLCNVNLPGLSGPELVQRMVAVRPDIRVIYVSGNPFSDDWVVPGRHAEFIQKPVTPRTIAQRLREYLDRTDTDQLALPR